MTYEFLFSAYLDLNIVLFLAACVWCVSRLFLAKGGVQVAHLTQLRVIYATLVLVAFTPVLAVGFGALQNTGQIPQSYQLSVTDYAVSQFLDGRIDMAALQFERLLTLRSQMTLDILTLATPVGMALAAALGFGVLLALGQTLLSAAAVAGIVRRSFAWRRFGRVSIWVSDEVQVPFSTRGLVRSHIVVPSNLLARSGDLRIAVSHELQHIRQGDLGWEIALEVLRPLFFWNPGFGLWKREVERVRELACDQQVLRRNTYGVMEYCDCLLRVCRTSLQARASARLLQPTVPFVQAEAGTGRHASRAAKLLQTRVLSLASCRSQTGGFAVMLFAVPMAFAIAFGVFATQPSQDWSQDRLMLSTIVNLERLDLRTRTDP